MVNVTLEELFAMPVSMATCRRLDRMTHELSRELKWGEATFYNLLASHVWALVRNRISGKTMEFVYNESKDIVKTSGEGYDVINPFKVEENV